MKKMLLWVEDSEGLLTYWKETMEKHNYQFRGYRSSEELLNEIDQVVPGIVVLGGASYGSLRLELLEPFVQLKSFPVVVMLKGDKSTGDVVAALRCGANDVVDGAISVEELQARLDGLVKLFERLTDTELSTIQFEDLVIDLKSRKVYRGDELIKLTPKEYGLLLYLAKRVDTACHREKILQEVWGHDFLTNTNVVDVYIRHLRSKIDRGRPRKIIHTIRGAGYMMH